MGRQRPRASQSRERDSGACRAPRARVEGCPEERCSDREQSTRSEWRRVGHLLSGISWALLGSLDPDGPVKTRPSLPLCHPTAVSLCQHLSLDHRRRTLSPPADPPSSPSTQAPKSSPAAPSAAPAVVVGLIPCPLVPGSSLRLSISHLGAIESPSFARRRIVSDPSSRRTHAKCRTGGWQQRPAITSVQGLARGYQTALGGPGSLRHRRGYLERWTTVQAF